ncbi:hypothetical protein AYL99_02913 [Fonsecaea erecta]|uniref:Lysozyme n=1 Tax=Fonsecaea erecta TaxID=1367422 RepID=A0A178ZWB9_9EURO|nr:hypothetical protein AYL99_02913 [Fonsecaea erecta]OAP63686.1 hypothetical protein AYL99_02913 [Fonsecaea erecta]
MGFSLINLLWLAATISTTTTTAWAAPPPPPSRFFSLHRLSHRDTAATAPDPVQQLLYIAPTSNTCAGATYPSECAVSSLAVVQDIVASFAQYNVTTAAEQAALLSWMAYESGEFKYNHNHFPAPGRPGQGTRTMMSPAFVQQYAESIPQLTAQVAAAVGTAGTPSSSVTDAQADQVLALVQPDQYSFAAAAWFYATHCTDAQKALVRQGGQQNWQTAFVTGCVGTTVDDGRVAYWQKACQALGVPVTP